MVISGLVVELDLLFNELGEDYGSIGQENPGIAHTGKPQDGKLNMLVICATEAILLLNYHEIKLRDELPSRWQRQSVCMANTQNTRRHTLSLG